MKVMDELGWLSLLVLVVAVWATGCTDPNACQTDEDCFQGQFCADDDRCTTLPGGGGDGGTTGGGTSGSGTGSDADATGSETGGSGSGGSGSDVGGSDGDDGGTGGTGGTGDAGDSGGSGADSGDSGSKTHRYIDVSAGENHGCGLLEDGRVICWGGPDETVDDVPRGERFVSIRGGEDVTCGRTKSDELRCWGHQDDIRQQEPDLPTDIAGLAFDVGIYQTSHFYPQICVQDVQSGSQATCYVINKSKDYNYSVSVSGQIRTISAGHTYACLSSDRGFACGDDFDDPAGTNDFTPPSNPAEFACSRAHCCAVDPQGGAVECFGDYTGEDKYLEAPAGTFDRVVTGFSYACARKDDGTVDCWGESDKDVPMNYQQAIGGERVSEIAGGKSHVCAVLNSDGTIRCWGANDDGRLSAPHPDAAAAMLDGQ